MEREFNRLSESKHGSNNSLSSNFLERVLSDEKTTTPHGALLEVDSPSEHTPSYENTVYGGPNYEHTLYAKPPVLPMRDDATRSSWRNESPLTRGRQSSATAIAAFAGRINSDPSNQHQENFAIPWYIILPNRPFHIVWDAVITVAIIYIVIWVPISMAFHLPFRVLDYMIEILFITDVALRFFTAYMTETMLLVTDIKLIAKHYVTTYFIIDLLACYPLYFHNRANFDRRAQLARLMRLLRLFRFHRYRYEGDVLSEYIYSPIKHRHPTFYRVSKLVLILFMSAHVLGCMFILAGGHSDPDPSSWLMGDFDGTPIVTHSNYGIYALGIYWCLTTMLTVGYGDISAGTYPELAVAGYGDISAGTYPELAVAVTTELVGVVVFTYITGIAVALVSSIDARETKFRMQMEQLGKFLHRNEFPKELQNTIRMYASLKWMQTKTGAGMSLDELKPMLPRPVQHDMCYHIYSSLIEKSNFLTNLLEYFKPFALELLTEFSVVRMKAGTVIPNGAWYIVSVGEVDTFVHGVNCGKLRVGRSFGLWIVAGAAPDPHLGTAQYIVQHTPTVMYSVSSESFVKAMTTLDHNTKICLEKYLASCIEIKRSRVRQQYEKAKERDDMKKQKSHHPRHWSEGNLKTRRNKSGENLKDGVLKMDKTHSLGAHRQPPNFLTIPDKTKAENKNPSRDNPNPSLMQLGEISRSSSLRLSMGNIQSNSRKGLMQLFTAPGADLYAPSPSASPKPESRRLSLVDDAD
eukprot:g15498.t1